MTGLAGMGNTLGQRIAQAARMAAAVHLTQLHQEQTARRQVTGGARSTYSTDGTPVAPFSGGDDPRRSSPDAEGGKP